MRVCLDWDAEEYTLLPEADALAVRAEITRAFDPAKHPRVPGGHHGGGEFAHAAGAIEQAAKGAAHAGGGEQRFGVPDSMSAHMRPDGSWDPERAKLHERIIGDIIDGNKRSANPTAVFLGGGPASGKSTAYPPGSLPGVAINPDDIKQMLPEYGQMLQRGQDRQAAGYVHEESSAVSKDVVKTAIGGKMDFTVDAVGDSAYEKMRAKLQQAKQAGYKVEGKYVTCDTAEAVRRAEERARLQRRHVDEAVVRAGHVGVSRTFAKLVENDDFDAVELWDTNGKQPRLIGKKPEGGTWQVMDEELWRRFLAKGEETP